VAKSRLPNPLERRHLIEREIPPAQALRIAVAYLEEGRAVESLEFLRKADARDRLTELRREAIEGGDAFLMRGVAVASGEPATREEWQALAEAASAAGKLHYAEEARRQTQRGKAGREE
jgi:hypothetical protein